MSDTPKKFTEGMLRIINEAYAKAGARLGIDAKIVTDFLKSKFGGVFGHNPDAQPDHTPVAPAKLRHEAAKREAAAAKREAEAAKREAEAAKKEAEREAAAIAAAAQKAAESRPARRETVREVNEVARDYALAPEGSRKRRAE